MGRVYAGPEPIRQEKTEQEEQTQELKPEAGQEQALPPEAGQAEMPVQVPRKKKRRADNPELFEMRDVYAGPEQMGTVREAEKPKPEAAVQPAVPEKPKKPPYSMMLCVYAGPDMMRERARARDAGETADRLGLGAPYPLNQMSSQTQTDSAAGKDMAEPETPGAVPASGAETELVTCPVCGEQNRRGKFCAYCGSALK